MATLSPARRAALNALLEAQDSGRYVRELLSASSPHMQALDSRDAAFALRLALGVTATEGCLDDILNQYLDKPNKVSARVRMALRISVCEALYLNQTPEVVVSQGVELVRSCAKSAAGLANAVLRRVCEGREAFLAAEDAVPEQRRIVSVARRAGLPVWLARRVEGSLGEERARRLFDSQLDPAPLAVHVNPLRASELEVAFASLQARPCELPGAYMVPHVADLVRAGSFERGDLVASDLAAQLVATAATRVGSCLEIGAGRGTKTYMMHAQAQRAGLDRTHLALDLSEGKCRANVERIAHAGFGQLETVAGDACELEKTLAEFDVAHGSRIRFDTVFVDAPCSGTGTMRRHPEIPWRLSSRDVRNNLPGLQLSMLMSAARRVAADGELIYATCSVLDEENMQVINAFLDSETGADFRLAPVSDAYMFALPAFAKARDLVREHEHETGVFQSVPAPQGFDGHFCARLVRCNRA